MNSKLSAFKRTVTSVLVVLGLCISILSPVASAAEAPHGGFTGVRYYYADICILKKTEFWPVSTAAYYFNTSGKVHITVRTAAQGCNDFPITQRLVISYVNEPLSASTCGDLYEGLTLPYTSHPNPRYSRVYAIDTQHLNSPQIVMNVAGASCYSTATRKAHYISHYIGEALGLAPFNNASLPYSAMNNTAWSVNNVAWAQGYDRNGIYYLYGTN